MKNLEDIYLYIAEVLKAPINARKQYERIVDRIMKLSIFPWRYHVIESEPGCSMGLRVIPVDNYSIIYLIRDDKIFVTNILYSASNLHERLR